MEQQDLKEIFLKYRDKVFGFFLKSLGDRELAADLTQDLFYKLCIKKEELDRILDLNSYIYWMAQNMVIDHLRRAAHQKKYRQELIEAWRNSQIGIEFQKPAIEKTIDAEYYTELFDQLILDLTPQQQLIIKLSKKEGLPNKVIAKKLGLSPNTVKNHLHQALKTLRSNTDLTDYYSIIFWMFSSIMILNL